MYENEEKSGNKEMSLLEDLFYGGIRPCDSFQPNTPDIRRLTDKVNQLYEDILNALPKDNQHLIHDMMNSQMFLTTDNVACAFAEGFRLGVKMSAEVWGK